MSGVGKWILASALAAWGWTNAAADVAEPAGHMNYNGDNVRSDIIMNSVMVPRTAATTYFEVLGWHNEDGSGGYAGIQDHPDGHNFIFSIWNPNDPNNTTLITAPYIGSGTVVSPFEGEGRGLKSVNFQLGWAVNGWYQLLSRRWQHLNHTYYGFWSQDMSTGKWTHLVTMDYPVSAQFFFGHNDAFLEDFASNGGDVRKALFKDAWQRGSAGNWNLQKSAQFRANDGTGAIHDNAFNAGIENGSFFMQEGGNTAHTFPGRTVDLAVTSSAVKPASVPGQITAFTLAFNGAAKTIDAAWDVNNVAAPQFAYRVELYPNPDFTGTPALVYGDSVPQARAASLNASALAGGVYYGRVSIQDVFANTSAYKTVSVTIPKAADCADPVWNPATAYVGGSAVSWKGAAYLSKWWTQGEDPSLKSGPDDVWKKTGTCGAGPVITITSPIPVFNNNNAIYLVGGSLKISATVADAGAIVTKVEISRGGGNTVTLTAAPYTTTFSNLPAPAPDGSIWFNVKAYDNNGATATALIVAYKDRAPLIAITAPQSNASFTAGSTVGVTTYTTDADGAVAKVEFFNGAAKLGEAVAAPFSFNLANAVVGTYSLTAKATDDLGVTAVAGPVSFIVVKATCTVPAWNAASVYTAGNRVSEAGKIYEAKWWTQGEDPALKSATYDVWKWIGACTAP